MTDPTTFQFDLPGNARPDPHPLAETIHPDAWRCWSTVTSERRNSARDCVRALVVHATAGASTSGAVSVMTDGRASFHWVVPDENEPAHGHSVYATAPEARAAWHVRYQCSHADVCGGAKGLNQLSLGVEIVNTQTGDDPFSPWQIEATAQIVRYAWAKYPNLRHVVSHARLDPARRTDPGADFPWARFEELVLSPRRACAR